MDDGASAGWRPMPTETFAAELPEVWALVQRCWSAEPTARPDFAEICASSETFDPPSSHNDAPRPVAAAPPAKHLGRKTKVSPSSPSLLMPAAVSVLLSKHHVYSLHDVVLCGVVSRQGRVNQASGAIEHIRCEQHSRVIFARDLQNGGDRFSVVVQQKSDVLGNLQNNERVTAYGLPFPGPPNDLRAGLS